MKYVYIFLFLLICSASFAQKTLQVIDKTTSEVLVIQEYDKVKFYLKSGEFKGKIQFLNNSSILVNDAYFTLADIKAIEYSTKENKAKRAGGVALFVVGYGMVAVGSLDLMLRIIVNEIGYNVPYTRSVVLLGGGAASIAAGKKIFGKKKQYDNFSYTFKIEG